MCSHLENKVLNDKNNEVKINLTNEENKFYSITNDYAFKKIFTKEKNLAAWSQIGEDKSLIAFDAPTSNMYINYKNSSYTIPFLIYMDEEERNIFFNIRDEVFNLEKEENLIKTEETEKNDINNIMMGMIYDNNLKN